MSTNDVLSSIVKKIDTLPTLPTTFAKINNMIQNPKTSANDISDVVSKDQVLTARLLKLVNSSLYGFPGRITTVSSAVVILGFNALKNLVLSSSVFDLFQVTGKSEVIDLNEFWKHSIACAVASRLIAVQIDYGEPEELFVAGLLHDIGKLVEIQYLQASFMNVIEKTRSSKILIGDAEKEILGFTHSDIGFLLGKKWKLPLSLNEAIACHNDFSQARKFPQLVSAVHLADILVRAKEIGDPGDIYVPVVDASAWDSLGLRLSQIETIMERIEEGVNDALKFFKREN
ncbi:MAG: HDOD domain-containing protein [Candidatus Aureabacteria bacterium]|nr:HDOD domain-containing protein [Candidatus Auribacterota bacterium]